jgi:hypothetical protein
MSDHSIYGSGMSLNINEMSTRFTIEKLNETIGKSGGKVVSVVSFDATHAGDDGFLMILL